MFDKAYIKMTLIMTMAALFVVAFAYQALAAYADVPNPPYTFTGKIISLDKDYKWITVEAGPNDVMNFGLVFDGVVTKCGNMSEDFRDLNVGDQVAISYFEEGSSGYIASNIEWLPTDMRKC